MKNNMKETDYYKSGKHSENSRNAIKKATIVSQAKAKIRKEIAITEYNLNPKECKNCKNVIDYQKRNNNFCSKTCSARYNNKLRTKDSRLKQRNSIRKTFGTIESEYYNYQIETSFKFDNSEYPKILGYDLLLKYKMYHTAKNPNGVVRDHMYSRYEGYKNGIDPSIISHPANCQFITHIDNTIKNYKSCITIDELLERIKNWK